MGYFQRTIEEHESALNLLDSRRHIAIENLRNRLLAAGAGTLALSFVALQIPGAVGVSGQVGDIWTPIVIVLALGLMTFLVDILVPTFSFPFRDPLNSGHAEGLRRIGIIADFVKFVLVMAMAMFSAFAYLKLISFGIAVLGVIQGASQEDQQAIGGLMTGNMFGWSDRPEFLLWAVAVLAGFWAGWIPLHFAPMPNEETEQRLLVSDDLKRRSLESVYSESGAQVQSNNRTLHSYLGFYVIAVAAFLGLAAGETSPSGTEIALAVLSLWGVVLTVSLSIYTHRALHRQRRLTRMLFTDEEIEAAGMARDARATWGRRFTDYRMDILFGGLFYLSAVWFVALSL
ncbi:MAG: hypothetical protein O2826_01915 [Chloroflexi bacterium]|nr:hypothetical protein [Chloroflexota bacterium]MDA1173258.1 hypothetical protein [Chloroflexota bacterium]